ncbi:hypothetical protein OBJ96_04115 [Empedobacter falsenii]
METFCSIVAFQIIIGLVVIPFYLFSRVYYYFMPSLLIAYENDKFEVVNDLNRVRFTILSFLLFLSFFVGILGTKYILTFDKIQFSLKTGFIIEFVAIIFLFIQFTIGISIENKIPNSLIPIINENIVIVKNVFKRKKNVLKNELHKKFNEIKFETEINNKFFLIKNSLLLYSFNVKVIELSNEEIDKICNDNINLFEDVTQMHSFINLISSQFINHNGEFITEKIYLKAKNSIRQNDKKKICEFLLNFIVFNKSEKYKFNKKHIEFLNKYFILNNIENPFNSKDSRKYF